MYPLIDEELELFGRTHEGVADTLLDAFMKFALRVLMREEVHDL
jgi:hypothetical protein